MTFASRAPCASRVRRLALAVLTLSIPSILGACGNDITTNQAPAFGTYDLAWVNGDTLPVATGETEQNEQIEVLAGRIFANTDQTCEFHHTFRMTSLDDQTVNTASEVEPCEWQLIGQVFNVSFDNGGFLAGVLSEQALWFDFASNDGSLLRFRYQRSGDAPS
jgi:hypothetical protein